MTLQECAIAWKTERSSDVFETAMKHVMRMISRTLRRARNCDQREDLIAEARAYVCQRLDSYDPSRGIMFSTYIHNSLRFHLAEEFDRAVLGGFAMSGGHIASRRAAAMTGRVLRVELDREPTAEEVARACAISVDEVVDTNVAAVPMPERLPIAYTIPDADARIAIAQEIERLPTNHRSYARACLLDEAPVTAVARAHGVSKQRVGQIVRASVKRIRRALQHETRDATSPNRLADLRQSRPILPCRHAAAVPA